MTGAGDPGPASWRPGHYVERTAFAWRRTALSLLAVAGAVLRLGTLDGSWLAVALGAGGCLMSLVLVVVSLLRRRRTELAVAAGLEPRARWSVIAAVLAVGCAGLATLVVLASGG